MRRLATVAVATSLLAATAVPALAHPSVELAPTLPTDLTHARTDNVDYLGRFPEHTGTAGGRLHGDVFFVTDPRGVYAYDVSDPADPALLGSLELYQTGLGAALAQEDPDTNGEILLLDGAASPTGGAQLTIVDVSDPTSLSVLSTVPLTAHTWNCITGIDAEGEVNSCAYAYSREGYIVDLTDPANPEQLEGWREQVDFGTTGPGSRNPFYSHDLTEVRPGLVMTAGSSSILMDTSDPANPVELTRIDQQQRFNGTGLGFHSVEWADGGQDPILVAGTEIAPSGQTNTAGSDCVDDNSVIETWDASAILDGLAAYDEGATVDEAFAGREFTKLDAFDAGGRGIFLLGGAPAHVLYCAHWMEQAPDFAGGTGRIAVSYYDRGTRFVEVGADGEMSEIGWMVPAEGYSGSVQWIGSDESGDILYVMDYRRGLEVLRLRPQAATGVVDATTDVVAASSTGIVPAGLPGEGAVPVSSTVAAAAGLALATIDVRRRRRRTADAA